ncbi:MAG: hypothetical protein K2J73_02770 [Oscillospiraceae bacterium]|nr:hypothetical protein [Oscillospiraceae bacterium]
MFGNKVIAGYLEGESVRIGNGLVLIGSEAVAKWTVESYEVVSEEKNISLASGLLRGAAGKIILGPWGVLAALTAKKKGAYSIALHWKNGKKSLLETDEKVYKAILKNLF